MSVHLRPATAADRQAILGLMRSGDYNRTNLRPSCFLVAEAEGNTAGTNAVIGIGQVKRHWDGTPELASLVVAEAYRGQGIGGVIVQALVERHFAGQASEALYLFCLSTLATYYQRFGFRCVERCHLPWPLRLMHWLGNTLGQLVSRFGSTPFAVVAMRIDAQP